MMLPVVHPPIFCNDLFKNYAFVSLLCYHQHYVLWFKAAAFYSQYLIAVMQVKVDPAAGEMPQQQGYKCFGLRWFAHVGFKDFDHEG